MFKRLASTIVLVLMLAGLVAGQAAYQTLLGTLSSVTTTSIYSWGDVAKNITIVYTVTGSPGTCQFQIEGSAKPSAAAADMVDMSGSILCTSSGMIHIADKPISSIRANLTILTGGTAPTVAFYFTGIR